MMLAAVIVLGVVAAAGWWSAVDTQRALIRAERRITAEVERNLDVSRRHALYVAQHEPTPDVPRTAAQHALVELRTIIAKAEHSRQLTGWVSTGALDRVLDLLEPLVECTGVTASWCPVHGDCTCPRLDDGDFETRDDPSCPLHAPDSDHAEDLP